MHSYAQTPTALLLDDRIRVFFATRSARDINGNYVSNTTFVDLCKYDPSKILYIHDKPILSLGPKGSFSQHGISPSHVLKVEAEIWLYYGGWSRQIGVPYQIAIGLAKSRDGGTNFSKVGEGPVLDRSAFEPFGPNSVWVGRVNGKWRMIYSAVLSWSVDNGHQDARYIMFTAHSQDGVQWVRDGIPVFNPKDLFDCQCLPTVYEGAEGFHLWFSHRRGKKFRSISNGGYQVSHLVSADFSCWTIGNEDLCLHHSERGFDSQMVCYPSVVGCNDKIYLFYCGNHFGEAGFGYAELEGTL